MKRTTTGRCFFLAAFLFAVSLGQAQVSVIPQIVDGGPWLTTIAITNTSASQAIASLSSFQETGGGNTSSWPLNFVEKTSAQTQDLVLAGGSTLFLHTFGAAANTTIGWGQLSEADGAGSVVAYAIFTQRVPGRSDQDGTAPAAAAISRILVPFDNTSGAVTSMAIANTTSSSESIAVGIRTASATTQAAAIMLPAQGHASFSFPTEFPATAGQSGLAEFYAASGSFSILALKFNSGAFTTAPVYGVTGPPIIVSTSGGGGAGNIVSGSFTLSKINTASASLPPAAGSVTDQIVGDFASYSPAEWQLAYPAATFGPCIVVSGTYPILGKAPYSPDSFLDAGTVDINGPGLSNTALTKITALGGGPFYDLYPSPGTLVYGGTYTLSSNGGTQIGPFSISGTLPTSFSVTNWDQITSINRAADFPVSWAGSGFGTVIIGASGTTQTATTKNSVSVTCVVAASLGTFSIPQGALAMLPAIAASSGPSAGVLLVSAVSGAPAAVGNASQALTPSLVGGGQVNYGNFGPSLSVVKPLSIQ